MYEGVEKRKYKRTEKPFAVSFRIIPLVAKRTFSADWDTVTIKDVGVGGVYFQHDENIEVGELLDLKIGNPTSAPPIHCVGKVIRVEKSPSSSPFSIAIEFTSLNPEEKEVIKWMVEEALGKDNCSFTS